MIGHMDYTITAIILAVLGLLFGSFTGATVWRLRARQLVEDKATGEKVDAKEYKTLLPLTKATLTKDRSRCLHCTHTLAWYDLVPLVSWLSTRGKCRYCQKSIGWFEPSVELGMALFFVVSFLAWPSPLLSASQIAVFVLWLVAGIFLAILFAYDAKWFLLPNKVVLPLTVVAALVAIIRLATAYDTLGALVSLALAVFILSGLYLIIWLVSKGRWIGFGDVKLGLALALLLGDWQLAFIALFAANLLGCLVVIPGMIMGKIGRQTRVPFGPLLILGTIIALLWGGRVIAWYFTLYM
jgi:prepilin signal peptidase PulO-like enzyme (type II secretory pathway)